MIFKLAWRNIWRRPVRSIVVIGAIGIGIWAAIALSGFVTGFMVSYTENAITSHISHLQIHNPDFIEEENVRMYLKNVDALANAMNEQEDIKAFSLRSVANGMLSSPRGARGIKIKGINSENEKELTALHEKIVEGEYFSGERSNEILISQRIAEKLKVSVRKKVVLTFQDLDREITAGAFRIVGLYDTGNNPFDDMHVFVLRQDLNKLLVPTTKQDSIAKEIKVTKESLAHEMAILVHNQEEVDSVKHKLLAGSSGNVVRTYREISPDLELYESQMKNISTIYLVIIMLALVFGIINTMLMAVLERIREIGMLMAIGMNKIRLFLMIMVETILLSFVAAPVGILLGYLTISYLGYYGIDLSAFSESLQNYGMSDVIYFSVDPSIYQRVPIAISITAILASLYPAFKAISLKPVEAIRKI